MSSRTLTIDTPALYFTGQILFGAVLVVAVWYAWTPFQILLSQEEFGARAEGVAAAGSALPEGEHAPTIERILRDAEGSGTVFAGERLAPMYHYVPDEGTFVSVDLVNNEVTLYDDGSREHVFEVVRSASVDAPHALKEGVYTVESTHDVELSTLAMVRFPSYVRFGGGYALHGEPTDEQGEGMGDVYTGGSVELSDEDAAMLLAFVKENTPVHVRTASDSIPYAPHTELVVVDTGMPATTATSFVVSDLVRGQVVLEKKAGARVPIASITKLVTAAVASDVVGHGAQVKAPNGARYTLGELYYPLLMRSDNKVAANIAAHKKQATFIAAMNSYVDVLGMPVTSFADASGLSPYNVSSAYDLATLARHLYLERAYLLDISREDSMTITSSTGVTWDMQNQNKLAGDPHFRGGKLGYTDEAGQTALSIFNVPLDGETRTVAVIVLGSKDWKQDTRTLLRWLLESVEVTEV